MSLSVDVRNVTKRYGAVVANDQISCRAVGGEVHAVLGENGAGKTTLMRMLAGLERPDAGTIEINGTSVAFGSPRQAITAGVGMVHQHFSLVPTFTVAENLALSSGRGILYSPRSWISTLRRSSTAAGMDLRWDTPVWRLSMGERQRVEIFRLILHGARILVLDEPTSLLASREAEQLFKHIRRCAEAGSVVFFVSHKIQHVLKIADSVTVLRRGRVVATLSKSDVNERRLVELMGGRVVNSEARERRRQTRSGHLKAVLQVQNLSVRPITSPNGLQDVSFSLNAGEIVGIAGQTASGQDELFAALNGAVSAEGNIQLAPAAEDVAYIPADRDVSTARNLSIRDNLILRDYRFPPLSRGPLLRDASIVARTASLMTDYDIRPSDVARPLRTLSGGNQQRVVLARELSRTVQLVIAQNPTSGLDIGTVEFVHRRLLDCAENGAGVLLMSDDVDELVGLCDRVLVLFEGRLNGEFVEPRDAADELGNAISGLNVRDHVQPGRDSHTRERAFGS